MTSSSPAEALPSILATAFNGTVPAKELDAWTRLSPAQRARALQRVEALSAWNDGRGEIGAAEAALKAGVGLSRFYRLAAEWRAGPSLAAVGTFASSRPRGSKFDADAINALQAAVPQVVRLNGGASVTRLVELLVEAAAVPEGKLPGMTKLREIVQDEVRRVAATHDAGTAVVFDCVASSLPREDRRPHIIFACLDRGTRSVLGVALGEVEHAVPGYARAAADALRSIEADPAGWPWGRRLARAELTAGMDVLDCEGLVADLNAVLPGSNFQLARQPKRFGRYLRELIGPRLGRITFTPTRTAEGEAMPANGDMTAWTEVDALVAVRTAADAYNKDVLTDAEPDPEGLAPATLMVALRTVSERTARS